MSRGLQETHILRQKKLCEEHHDDVMRRGGFTSRFCGHCYERDGWKCFPCNDIAEIYSERYGETLPGKAENNKKKHKTKSKKE
ncbi:MAG: hypothetical protein WED05_08570 [Candidatus Atabeyarchaeum deiterrae]